MRHNFQGLATLEIEVEMAATTEINEGIYKTDQIELTVLYAYATLRLLQ